MFIWVLYQCMETLDKWNAMHAGAMTLQNIVSRFQLNILYPHVFATVVQQ